MQKCLSCGGEYEPIQRDGTRYFHTCAPIAQFFDDLGTPISADAADGILRLGGKVYRRDVERANKRDENISATRTRKGPATMKADGDGATTIARPVDPLEGAVLIDGSAATP